MERIAIIALVSVAAMIGYSAADAPVKSINPTILPLGMGLTVPGRIVAVHDGDTLTVECRFVMDVRLIDCYAPEVTGPQKPQGIVSRDNLRAIAGTKDCVINVPFTTDNIGSATSMSRVLGKVSVDVGDLSELQVKGGFAKATK